MIIRRFIHIFIYGIVYREDHGKWTYDVAALRNNRRFIIHLYVFHTWTDTNYG